MKDQLAEELLAKVMGWKSPQDFVEHGLPLQVIAAYKYDEYQQFSPGMRFIESLALWLGQFETMSNDVPRSSLSGTGSFPRCRVRIRSYEVASRKSRKQLRVPRERTKVSVLRAE